MERRNDMTKTKAAAAALGALSVCSLVGGIVTYAGSNDAVKRDSSLQNGYISLTVEQDKDQLEYLRFRLDTKEGQLGNDADNNSNITYRNFYSGYTTISIDGKTYIYGEGKDDSEPKYDAKNKCHISSQKFGDVVIQQKLTLAEGFTEGYEDMLEISYKVLKSTPENAIGVRILIDPMIGDDDMLMLSVSQAKIANETLLNKDIPTYWTASLRKNNTITAYGKLDTADPKPSSVLFANWDNAYDKVWDYEPDIEGVISDASAAVIWQPVSKAEGTEFKTLYGVKNTNEDDPTAPGKKPSDKENDKPENEKQPPKNEANISSPQTGSSFPAGVIALLGVSVVSAGASLILSRKGGKHGE